MSSEKLRHEGIRVNGGPRRHRTRPAQLDDELRSHGPPLSGIPPPTGHAVLGTVAGENPGLERDEWHRFKRALTAAVMLRSRLHHLVQTVGQRSRRARFLKA